MITERTSVFQGLRLIGIVTIVAGHSGLSLVGGGNWCTFFFVLSGFLYKGEISDVKEYGRYVWKKASRVYPVYWFCLSLYLLLAVIRGCEEQYTLHWDFLPHFLLLQTWLPNVSPMAYLGLAWFLSALLFCYLFAPFINFFVVKSKYAVLLFIVGMSMFYLLGMDRYLCPLYRLCEYSIGVWMYKWLCQDTLWKKELFPGCMILLVLCFLSVLHFGVSEWFNLPLFSGVIYALYMYKSDSLQILFGNRIVIWLSKSDMFIYLSHAGIGFHFVYYFITTNAVVATVGSVVIGVILSELYYRGCQCIAKKIEISTCLNSPDPKPKKK